jgi:cephalosporin-C deacetylase
VPAGAIGRGVVVGHGYGGREQPEWQLPGPAAVAIFPCARGFHRSATPEIPNNSARHVLHGIASRDTYSHRGSAADLWGAASVLLELYPHVAGNLDYMGGSFGGGMGALMLPWDQRFRRGFLDVPSHGNYPLRIKFACEGSGDAVQHYFWEHPEVMDVLKYHDATLAAKHIRIPMLVAPALLDPKVPPPGQFSVYNAIPGDKQLFVRQWGHVDWPTDDGVRLTAALNTFFS